MQSFKYLYLSVFLFFLGSISTIGKASPCEDELQAAISAYKNICSGTRNCYVAHPWGHMIPTEDTHTVAPDIRIEDTNVIMECVPSKCPEYQYAIDIPPPSSTPLCENPVYVPSTIEKARNIEKNDQKVCGSIVNVDSQTVGESIPLPGVNFSLNYFSHLSPGRNRSVKINLTGPIAPPLTNGFTVEIRSDDGVYLPVVNLPNVPNLTYNYTWNGLDLNGQKVLSPKKFKILTRQIYTTNENQPVPIIHHTSLGSLDVKPLGLGGWLPSIYHFYDKETSQLFSGDGAVRNISPQPFLENDPDGAAYAIGSIGNKDVYYFDVTGKHLFTKTTLTGLKIFTFNYDNQGQLLSITQPFGKTTTFQRDNENKLEKIIAPYGTPSIGSSTSPSNLQSSSLVLLASTDSDGYLSALWGFDTPTHQYQMSYTTTGLLRTFTKPDGQQSSFSHNTFGELILDSHSGGYFFHLAKTLNTEAEKEVILSSNEQRREEYRYSSPQRYSSTRTVIYPTGMQKQILTEPNSTRISVGDTIYQEYETSDWRFPESSYINWSYQTTGPYSKYNTSNIQVNLADYNNPFSITSMILDESDGYTTATTLFDGLTKTFNRTTSSGKTLQYKIDDYERVTQLQSGSHHPISFSYTNEHLTSINQNGRQTTISYSPSTGFPVSYTNPRGETTALAFNASGLVSNMILPDLRSIQFSYNKNGILTSLTNPKNITHYFSYNGLELPGSYIAPSAPGNSNYTTSYSYNSNKQLSKITKPGNEQIFFDYSPTTTILNKIRTPAGNYDLNFDGTKGVPLSIKSPSGLTNSIIYSGQIPETEHLLDSAGNNIGTYMRGISGRRLLSDDVIGTSNYYGVPVYYDYDEDSNLTKVELPYPPFTGQSLTLNYNENNQLIGTQVGPENAQISDYYLYNAFGEITNYKVSLGNETLYKIDLIRDISGRITSKTQYMRGQEVEWSYTYDTAGRLTEVSKNGSVRSHYNYDLNSNRIGGFVGPQTIVATYDNQDRISSYNQFVYTYKPDGSLYKKKNGLTNFTNTYQYDSFGNLKKYYSGDVPSATYEHDGFDRIAGRYFNGNIDRRWIYMDQYRIAGEMNKNGVLQKRFIYASKGNVPDLMVIGDQIYRIISDHLGSPRLTVRVSDGTIVSWMDHDEFGQILENYNPLHPFGFAGGFYDGKTPLVRFGARDYDPEVGRWTAKDPILFAGRQTNLYGYTFNDPVNFIDPTGTVGLGGAIIGGVVGGVSGYLTGISTGANPAQAALAGAAIGAASGFTGAYLLEGAAALGVGTAGQIFAGSFGAFQTGFVGSLLSQQISGQRPSVGDAAKQGGMCAVGAGGGAVLGLGYSSGAQMAIDGAFGASLIPIDLLLAR